MGGRMAVGNRLSARTIVLDTTMQLLTIQEVRRCATPSDSFRGHRPHSVCPSSMPSLPLRALPCRPRAVGTQEAPQVWWLHSRQEEWKRLRRTSHDLRGYKQPLHHVFKTCEMAGLEPS